MRSAACRGSLAPSIRGVVAYAGRGVDQRPLLHERGCRALHPQANARGCLAQRCHATVRRVPASSEPDDEREPRGKPRRAGLAVLGIPGLAVILALVLRWSTPTGGLVRYELELLVPKTSLDRSTPTEGAAPPHVTLEPGQHLNLLLRPRRPFEDPVEARVFVERQPGSLQREPVPFAVEAALPSGALRVSVDSHELPARGRLLVIIGRPGSLPSVPAGSAAHGRNWQRFDIDVDRPAPAAPQQ